MPSTVQLKPATRPCVSNLHIERPEHPIPVLLVGDRPVVDVLPAAVDAVQRFVGAVPLPA